jgi:hypothetical protein
VLWYSSTFGDWDVSKVGKQEYWAPWGGDGHDGQTRVTPLKCHILEAGDTCLECALVVLLSERSMSWS